MQKIHCQRCSHVWDLRKQRKPGESLRCPRCHATLKVPYPDHVIEATDDTLLQQALLDGTRSALKEAIEADRAKERAIREQMEKSNLVARYEAAQKAEQASKGSRLELAVTELRVLSGLQRSVLARKLGCSRVHLWRIEFAGYIPKAPLLKRMADFAAERELYDAQVVFIAYASRGRLKDYSSSKRKRKKPGVVDGPVLVEKYSY